MSDERAQSWWRLGPERGVRLGAPRIMGVVNATPDSFSDGGEHPSVESLVGHALRMVEQGAELLDVGGESTRPGATRIEEAEQIRRTLPVVQGIRRCGDVPISIDTTRAAVAEAALDAGADIINDVAAGLEDPDILSLAADRGCGLILMHRRVPPDRDSYSHEYAVPPAYDDVVAEVGDFLAMRIGAALDRGVASHAIVIDPGLGFGKSVEHNWELVARTAELFGLGYPVLGAASRKSFIGVATGADEPRSRVAGSVAVSVMQYLGGVRLFRAHDVRAHREALAVARSVDEAHRSTGRGAAGLRSAPDRRGRLPDALG